MKGLILGTLLTSTTLNLFAQGTISFANVASGTAISNIITRMPLSGTTFKAALYYAPDGVTDEASFIALDPPTMSFLQTGQFAAGTRSTPSTTPPGGFAMFQVRVWEVVFGSSYEVAVANATAMDGRFALAGKSYIVRVKTGNSVDQSPGNLVLAGLRGFYVTTNRHGPLLILLQPRNVNVTAGAPTLFSVTADGLPPLRYQWRLNGVDVPGATHAGYFLSSATPAQAGSYDVVVRNNDTSLVSQIATLTLTDAVLLVNINGPGTVTRAPDQTNFPPNAIVTLTATADLGYAFFNWTGDATGNANPLTLTLDTSKTVTANFVSTALPLTVEGMGSITKTPDKPLYELGEQVTLTVTPARYYVFTQWSDGVTDNPRVITIGANNRYTAITVPTQPLETLTFGGISRTAPVGMPAIFLDGQFIVDTSVSNRAPALITITTTFPNGVIVYTLDGSPPTGPGILILYTGPFYLGHSATLRAAAFPFPPPLHDAVEADPVQIVIFPGLQASSPGGGTVTVSPPDGPYFSNSIATISATPAPGWRFLQWLGDASGTNPVVNLQMTRDKCVQAIFGTALNLLESEGGAFVTDPVAEFYPYGSRVRLIAVPRSGYYFVVWSGAASGTNSSLNIVVTNAEPSISGLFGQLSLGKSALALLPFGNGRVTTTPRANRYDNGSTVTLTALPDPGEIFLGWNGDAGGTNLSLQVTLDQTHWISASFTRRPRMAVADCPGPSNGEVFPLILTGDPGRYSLDASSDLLIWTPLATLTNLFGTVQFNDPLTTDHPHRFYRLRSAP